VWSVKRVFLFDAIYERVKRVTKRMTASRGAFSRGSRRPSADIGGFTARRLLNYGCAARTDERIKAFAGQFGAGCPRTTIYEARRRGRGTRLASRRLPRAPRPSAANARMRGLIRTAGIAKSMFTLRALHARAQGSADEPLGVRHSEASSSHEISRV